MNTGDFFVDFGQVAIRSGLRLYLLVDRRDESPGFGGTPQAISGDYDRWSSSWIFRGERGGGDCSEIVDCGTEVLWVGMGCPRQEFFCVRNRHRLRGVAWIRTCGGSFDQFAGRIGRAPLWMRRAGLEWLFRLAEEPRRLAPRYLATNLPALYHLATKTGGERQGVQIDS